MLSKDLIGQLRSCTGIVGGHHGDPEKQPRWRLYNSTIGSNARQVLLGPGRRRRLVWGGLGRQRFAGACRLGRHGRWMVFALAVEARACKPRRLVLNRVLANVKTHGNADGAERIHGHQFLELLASLVVKAVALTVHAGNPRRCYRDHIFRRWKTCRGGSGRWSGGRAVLLPVGRGLHMNLHGLLLNFQWRRCIVQVAPL
ncbi:hypothetical protein H310_05112 [Aphanomyces invadans]|uniref:Uncharacterized protein n=1 Tax=Aphanomyces invadans TaxID=157072 RepID=A0A024UDN0_9STRA|nr:hypothetical protein H310_05112 [Aphanomyces invadans]ETW03743.1 hypothetical protein H310_05112 [Aphanomyces invadans]|eukprot:XP_008867972.1 hypothetical protein H310_05112 [Aphanomyces invadans]